MKWILLLLTLLLIAAPGSRAAPALQAPVLKWQRGGCTSWCETGWYSSPAVADLDGDGQAEVVGAAYSVFALNGTTGATEWRMDPLGGRAWPGVVVADLEGDGTLEVVTAHGDGYLHVWNAGGSLRWSRQPTTSELRSLAVYDLEGDGALEIVVSAAIESETNTWAYDSGGALRPGWPQLSNDSGYAAGIYNANVAVGDLDGDGLGEIVAPSDVHYICAYERSGTQIPANAMYGGRGWGKVGVWESLEVELRGWGECSGPRAERYRTNFAHGAAVIADLDGNGAAEVVVTGNVYDCAVGHPPGRYNGVYVFHADRSRFQAGGFDWRTLPVDTGAPLSEDYDVIENNQPNPAVADLDGDGRMEIIYSSYDGRVHGFWLDKTEHGDWPYSVYDSAEGVYRFASEPAVADLDNDGQAEILVASWPEKAAGLTGRLHVLDYLGRLLYVVDLPAAADDWNGGLAAPTLANIDGDADLEVVINTVHTGLVAYDLPDTAHARVLWGTGRGNVERTGALLRGSLDRSWKGATPVRPAPGQVVTYTLVLANPGPALAGVRVTDTLPLEVTFRGTPWASAGDYGVAGNVITWTGTVEAGVPVTVTFGATVSPTLSGRRVVVNSAWLDDGAGTRLERRAPVFVNGVGVYLPVVMRQ